MIRLAVMLVILLLPSWAWGATYYVATTGNDANLCPAAQTITTPKLTFASAVACLNAGDTLYIRAGTYNQRIDLAGKTGAAGQYITIAGYPTETVTIRYTSPGPASYGPIKTGGVRGWIIVENLILDGVNETDGTPPWAVRDGNHDMIARNLEIKGFSAVWYFKDVTNFTIENCTMHDSIPGPITPTSGGRVYGLYVDGVTNGLVQGNHIYHNVGGGIQVYNGQHGVVNGLTIRRNYIHDNNFIATSPVGGIILSRPSGAASVTGITIVSNVIANNGSETVHGTSAGITIQGMIANTMIYNNVIYNNHSSSDGSVPNGYGVLLQTYGGGYPTGTVIRNNLNTGNQAGSSYTTGSTVTQEYNACLSGEACGATGKKVVTAITDCTVSTSNFTHKAGSLCINAGTTN